MKKREDLELIPREKHLPPAALPLPFPDVLNQRDMAGGALSEPAVYFEKQNHNILTSDNKISLRCFSILTVGRLTERQKNFG